MSNQEKKSNNILSFLMRLGLSGALLYYVFSKIDISKTHEIVKSADLFYLSLGLALFFLCNLFMFFRWYVFIQALDLNASVRDAIRCFMIGLFGNLFLPSAVGGDLLKILGLCKDSSQKPRVVASVLLDRLSGFASLAIVAISSFTLGYALIDDKQLVIPILFMASGLTTTGFILFNQKVYHFCCKVFALIPKLRNALIVMHDDILLLKNRKAEGFKAIGIACASQLTYAIMFFVVAKALHQDVSLVYFFIFVPIICVVSVLPSIGGLGVREAGAVVLFGRIGIESGVAASMSLISFFFMVIVGLIGGAVYVTTVSSRRLQHHSPDAA